MPQIQHKPQVSSIDISDVIRVLDHEIQACRTTLPKDDPNFILGWTRAELKQAMNIIAGLISDDETTRELAEKQAEKILGPYLENSDTAEAGTSTVSGDASHEQRNQSPEETIAGKSGEGKHSEGKEAA